MSQTSSQKSFITEDFLLQSEFAKILYHDYAKDLPIIDYHNHLPPHEIRSNRQFETISQAWLAGDHYKWRAMRTLGVSEKYITGKASDKEKFEKWAFTVPYTVRNPLFHWTHLELQRYFGIEEYLSEKSATAVYEACNHNLTKEEYRTCGLLKKMKVEVVCTTDDPIDSLEDHLKFHQENSELLMFPAFRPDKAFAVENPESYNQYLSRLEQTSNISIKTYDDLLEALKKRIEYFHQSGCRLADHGLEQLYFFEKEEFNIEELFKRVHSNKNLNTQEIQFFKFKILQALCREYHARGWVQQFHLGAIRNTNTRKLTELGPDTGYDSIGDFDQARALAGFLNSLDQSDQLCKTILYNLNPRDNEVFATMVGNFNDGSVKGKLQFGSGWWYLDQIDGMEKQLNALSNMSLLSCFIGMLTDSRSFLSFPRHEYFRRILCNLIGADVEKGLLPADEKWLGKIVSDICYFNAKNYFDFSPDNFQV
ncbi:glucuronate isomerase [Algoriphagus kandeliae]|uniref:Uronate isomerase n=1 Tax=Algoriphagus kandeliae TaxID=2562278 RepID=A0A4Y9QN17_9BACT|nr:glucuronate isomerase [Algoriphagus kandeliae]TFV92346.1 glucuronate isomerase [Algoriphagus kandeliae]